RSSLSSLPPPDLPARHSFPTRRSSDLDSSGSKNAPVVERNAAVATSASVVTMATSQARWIRNGFGGFNRTLLLEDAKSMALASRDRKRTRLNSSHVSISYAVFCLKKKK